MKYTLYTYVDQYDVDIPDGTTEVYGITVSGDEIMVAPCYYDPADAYRISDMLDGGWKKVLKDGDWVVDEEYYK